MQERTIKKIMAISSLCSAATSLLVAALYLWKGWDMGVAMVSLISFAINSHLWLKIRD